MRWECCLRSIVWRKSWSGKNKNRKRAKRTATENNSVAVLLLCYRGFRALILVNSIISFLSCSDILSK